MQKCKLTFPILAAAAALILAACGSGGGSGTPNGDENLSDVSTIPVDANDTNTSGNGSEDAALGKSEAVALIEGYLENVRHDVSVDVGFSPVKTKVCDVLGILPSNALPVCIRYATDDNTTYNRAPSQNTGPERVAYFLDIPAGTESEIIAHMGMLGTGLFQPVFRTDTEIIIHFGTHAINEPYHPVGSICVLDAAPDTLTLHADINGSAYHAAIALENDGSGCFTLPDVRGFGLGDYNVSNPTVTDVDLHSTALEGRIGIFSIVNTAVDCVGAFGDWYAAGDCNVACGTGTQEVARAYSVTTPAADGGQECPYQDGYIDTSTQSCDAGPCDAPQAEPVDCVGAFGDWYTTGECNVTCGTGTQDTAREFTITTAAANGGTDCPYANGYIETSTQSCDAGPCNTPPVISGVSPTLYAFIGYTRSIPGSCSDAEDGTLSYTPDTFTAVGPPGSKIVTVICTDSGGLQDSVDVNITYDYMDASDNG